MQGIWQCVVRGRNCGERTCDPVQVLRTDAELWKCVAQDCRENNQRSNSVNWSRCARQLSTFNRHARQRLDILGHYFFQQLEKRLALLKELGIECEVFGELQTNYAVSHLFHFLVLCSSFHYFFL